ncbi:hypothetical protein BFW87_02475 [Pseudomonas fluorescens]|uniref:Uncharacterized protein n=1 Tax=Pseudomonas fluorescens TaxID=294 RepID=A0A1T2Z6I6_PSEFL|nr:hypothetical protein BFW87_02475 [Pseudomonas fluorescens]
MWELACVGAGLSNRRTAAMQTPRYIRRTRLMPSQASQLPHLICVVAVSGSSPPFFRLSPRL